MNETQESYRDSNDGNFTVFDMDSMASSQNINSSISAAEEIVFDLLKRNQYSVIAIYFIVFVAALLANVLLIIIVVKDRYMQNVTNYFLVNLSVADLLVTLICMPNAAWKAYTDVYAFGPFTCKISTYLQGIAVASSIFTITAMAVDRYLAIIRPFGLSYRCFNKTTTVLVIFALWTFSLILFSPNLWIAELQPVVPNSTINVYMCRMRWSNSAIDQEMLGILWFIFMFAIPGLIMTAAYTMMGRTLCSVMPPFDNSEPACTQQRNRVMKSRKRVACILLLLAFVFAWCWLPYHILNLIVDTTEVSSEKKKQIEKANVYLLLLGHANSALNPIIYCALSRNFRNSIRNLLRTKIRCRRKKPLPQWADSSASGFQHPYNQKIKEIPLIQKNPRQETLTSRRQSSQKTTKTCAV